MLVKALFLIFLVFAAAAQSQHAPDQAPEIKRDANWCQNGSQTRTTGECICSSHMGFYCKEEPTKTGCQSGYGISFFHWSCMDCACAHEKIPIGEWKERKNALKQNFRKQQKLD